MTDLFTAKMMDASPSLHSSRFIQELVTHASTLAVSPLRPNGLNDLHVCVPSLAYILIHPDHADGFFVPPLDPLPADATSIDKYNHSIKSADLLVIIQAVQTLKTFALSIVGSVISATLKHPTLGFTKLRLVDIIDHVTQNYGILSRSDLAILDARLTSYSSSLNLAQNFTIFDETYALLKERQLPVLEHRKLDNLHLSLQSHLTQKVRFDQYLAHHPNRTTQTYAKAKKYLLQMDLSLSDLPLSSLFPPPPPPPSPPVAAAATASAPPPTALEFAALKRELTKLQREISARASSPAPPASPSPRTSTACRQCAALTPPVSKLYSKCKAHNPYAK